MASIHHQQLSTVLMNVAYSEIEPREESEGLKISPEMMCDPVSRFSLIDSSSVF